MQFVDKILFQINTEIEKLGIDDCMGIDSALHMMRFIQPLCDELRKYILAYQFADADFQQIKAGRLKSQGHCEVFPGSGRSRRPHGKEGLDRGRRCL